MPAYTSNFKSLTDTKPEEQAVNDNPFSLHGLETLDSYHQVDKSESPRLSHSYDNDIDSIKSDESYKSKHSSRSSRSYYSISSENDKKTFLETYSTHVWMSAFFLLFLSGVWVYYQQYAYDIDEDKDLSVMMDDRQTLN